MPACKHHTPAALTHASGPICSFLPMSGWCRLTSGRPGCSPGVCSALRGRLSGPAPLLTIHLGTAMQRHMGAAQCWQLECRTALSAFGGMLALQWLTSLPQHKHLHLISVWCACLLCLMRAFLLDKLSCCALHTEINSILREAQPSEQPNFWCS